MGYHVACGQRKLQAQSKFENYIVFESIVQLQKDNYAGLPTGKVFFSINRLIYEHGKCVHN